VLPQFCRELFTLLLPTECPVCGRSLRWGESTLCDGCLSVAFATQPESRFDLHGLKRIESACEWNSESRSLVRGFKYCYRPLFVSRLLPLVEDSLKLTSERIDLILPVPLHRVRQRTRGYNQAELLGRLLAQILQVPLITDNLIRIRNTCTQTRLQEAQRRRNVSGAFGVLDPGALQDRSLLIVDDVVTTGATLEEIAAILPTEQIRAWTLVRR
jgi:competence protein ComFC